MILLFIFTNILLGEIEIIPVNSQLNQRTYKYFWPILANGGIYIDSSNIYIADQNRILILDRDNISSRTNYDFKIHGSTDFLIKELTVTKQYYYFTLYLPDGRNYLYKTNRMKNLKYGPVLKHGNCDRMLILPNDVLLASGPYRPGYAHFLDLNDDEENMMNEGTIQDLLYSFYEDNKSFTVAYYDSTLKLIDSLNILSLTGQAALAFDRLYTHHPIDISKSGDIYLIDNSNGYTIKHFARSSIACNILNIQDPSFLALPESLTVKSLSQIRYVYRSFTQAYMLYIRENYIISSFYYNPEGFDDPKPPYYYDILDLKGNIISSGQLEYPVIAEDQANKVFLFIRLDDGWYKKDKLFLVGLTMNDFITGKATKNYIDKAISQWTSTHG